MTVNQESGTVSYAEAVGITGKRVGEFLQKELLDTCPRMVLSDGLGYPCTSKEATSFGVSLEKKSWTDCLPEWLYSHSLPVVACLYLVDEKRKANHKKWVLEIHGRKHVPYLKTIAEKLAKVFKVDIHIRLESEDPRVNKT